MSLFPLFLNLEGQPALVVGGGEIAEAKIASLLHAGADVEVVAPQVTATISKWAQSGAINWRQRSFAPDDVLEKQLVIAATSSPEVNHNVYAEARRNGVLCNVVDDPPYCDFYFPAVVRRGDLQIAISTGGQSPALAQQLRFELEAQFGPEYAERVRKLGKQRRSILATHPANEERKQLLHQLARKELGRHSAIKKRVYLIGAGPGDPELLTLKAHNLLRSADVVLHDDLVSPEILELARAGATLINVGKRHSEKRVTQEEIHTLMIHFASQELTVVRLKGGDPLIFGRASEEMQALAAAGVAFEVVPGITAASSAAAAAQVSLTDRRTASSVVFTTSHHCAGKEQINWLKMASRDTTVAIYMPGSEYAGLARDLEGAGFPVETPCVVVSGAGTRNQQVRQTTIARLREQPPLPAPALVLVGDALAAGAQTSTRAVEEDFSAERPTVIEDCLEAD